MNNRKVYMIIAFITLIMISMSFVSCGQRISGTFSYDDNPNYTITFKGKNYVGIYDGNDVFGKFSINEDRLILTYNYIEIVFRIVDNDTLRDRDGDIWNKKK